MKPAGNPPKDLGLIDLSPNEMMFWMYLPISVPGSSAYHLPENLRGFAEIVSAAKADDPEAFQDALGRRRLYRQSARLAH
jgi:hypothetical protein